jgi:hypothetical protein
LHLHPSIAHPSDPGGDDESPGAGGAGEGDVLVVALEALGDFDRPDSLLKLVELLLLGQE